MPRIRYGTVESQISQGWNCWTSDNSDFQISAPQCPTHWTPQGNGDVLDIAVRRNFRLSDVTVADALDSDHLLTLFHILDHVGAKDILTPVVPKLKNLWIGKNKTKNMEGKLKGKAILLIQWNTEKYFLLFQLIFLPGSISTLIEKQLLISQPVEPRHIGYRVFGIR